jgi:transcriptional regulator with XRE-family HTH domain
MKKKTLNDYLEALPRERRQKVGVRAKEILAEEMSLQELRKAKQQSQQKLAEVLHVKQGEISKIEHRTDMYVSTLRDYIEAMGGTLEITASFPNSPPIKINQFETEETEAKKTMKV